MTQRSETMDAPLVRYASPVWRPATAAPMTPSQGAVKDPVPLPSNGSGRTPPVDRLLAPFREFARSSASSGVLLIGATVIALVWANSAFAQLYFGIWETPLALSLGATTVSMSLHHFINDGLMAIFFLVVGLELKRELLVGELASRARATLPIGAAIGGAVLPALIYIGIVGFGENERGWGIPMATDIAFALGVLAILGSRVPLGLRIFVTAFAIVDDLIAVLVIAIFYTAQLNAVALAAAGGVFLILVAANVLGVRRPIVYGALGLMLWLAVYQSGVHATVAGVALAIAIPARIRLDAPDFINRARNILDSMHARARRVDTSPDETHAALWDLEDATEKAQSPMLRIEHSLQPWVAFGIVPLFALANAGVALTGDPIATLTNEVVAGVALGLLLGKQIGISVATWLMVRFGVAQLPDGVSLRHIYGAAWLGGIGFTMSLFIAELAFGGSQALAMAKIGVLMASLVAGIGGFAVLRLRSGSRNGGVAATGI